MSDQTKSVFVAATRQNDGKTMVSLGLFYAFKKRFSKISYMKPVGQQYKIVDHKKVDKDAILFKGIYNIKDSYDYMSPIAVPSGFTKAYIDEPNLSKYENRLIDSYNQLAQKNDFLLLEGTGHAGVGSVFDLSNATVANLLNNKVILVCIGGIGKSIDELLLNVQFFQQKGVEVLGVILNKVQMNNYDPVKHYVTKCLKRHKLNVLGAIPFEEDLSNPTIETLFEKLEGELLSDTVGFSNRVEKFVIGDTVPNELLGNLMPNSLLIVPSNREGLIMAALCGTMLDSDVIYYVSGIVLTGGKKPHPRILALLQRTHIPLLLVEGDSFSVANHISKMLIKIGVNESDKIISIQNLVDKHVDIDYVCDRLA